MGRHPKYKTPEEMETKIDAYFDTCDEGEDVEIVTKKGQVVTINQQIPYTMEGLVLALGFTSRTTLGRYAAKHEDYGDVITRARTRIAEHRLRECLLGNQDAKIGQLDLATHHGYQPKLELPVGAQIVIGIQAPKEGAAIEDSEDEKQRLAAQEPIALTE